MNEITCSPRWPASRCWQRRRISRWPSTSISNTQMHGAGGAVAQLQLKDGQKWPTDASLRSGMASIRAAFDADHPAIHAGKQTDAQYAALATHIDQQVKSIVANCHLPADADANLHLVIADLLQGVVADARRGPEALTSRRRGTGAWRIECVRPVLRRSGVAAGRTDARASDAETATTAAITRRSPCVTG